MEKNFNEEQIILLIQEPETLELGFRALVSLYSKPLYWHIRRIVLTHENADDVLQNTFLKAWLNLESFRGDAKLSTWLYRIAVNESLTFISKHKEKYSVEIDNPELGLENVLKSDPYFDGKELDVQLQKAIMKLPDKQRIVFLMKYYDDLKYTEISRILGTTVGALKASYHHAVKKIEEFISNLD
ncbi:RNA polymerase, sigma-24 subunit, ECF subfamily [Bacteroides coprosuis DSM 18011]|uniref:RNA polymerase sigma factor n=1 Tax=Bacteroides coprosuis DSM 18011 TaxID=679937 RepID=F3ZP00_9BACE|nr:MULTISPECIES: RNA polymerase sigma factor [Bacteroides]EGJ72573.1 RNA polymerase, sigma-24 subunit, ECF subfamily [Bacteroides coprosuis DSM 18011]HJD91183.1 RNA polymerase sigma factor [Bacteroides coprosuis]